jgi:hypothetical protein
MNQNRFRAFVIPLLTVFLLAAIFVTGCAKPAQSAAFTFDMEVKDPAYPIGTGPQVLIDEAHFNFHTAEGRYQPFAQYLRRDGFAVHSLTEPPSMDSLDGVSVLVIANALAEINQSSWNLPNPGAFTPDEIHAIKSWVEQGGSLLLIADHMPFPGAASDLADAFGIVMENGFAYDGDGKGTLTFSRTNGGLGIHPITQGRDKTERVDEVKTFMGQGFRIPDHASPLFTLPAGSEIRLPEIPWQFDEDTPTLDGDGMHQGAALVHGAGRVVIFGEAAAFTAQQVKSKGGNFKVGMNQPDASGNAQLLLNTLHWLVGQLPEK